MKARLLLIVTAAVEFMTGLALISFPSMTAEILLGSPLSSPSATIVGRVAGAALIAISVSCWLSRNDKGSLAAKALLSGLLLLYNITAALILIYACFVLQFSIMLLLTIILHLGLTAWCLFVLQYVRRNRR